MLVPAFSSIQVTPRMRRRLSRYKRKGMSYEDVLTALLDAIPPEDLHARMARAEGAAEREMLLVGRRDPGAAATEARALNEARLARMTPLERMEEAYRLSVLFRERS